MSELGYRTLRENVTAKIRMKIMRQELAPGARIVEKNLSDELGVSRGPIREALRQLEQEGLVEYTRNAGCSVKKITIADVYEIYLLRCTYEMLAVRIYDGTFSEEELAKMEQVADRMQTLHAGDLVTLACYDHELHRMIVAKAGLPRLTQAWEQLNYGTLIAEANSGSYKPNLASRQYTIHQKLLDTLRTGDVNTICRGIYQHYMPPVRQVIQECEPSPDTFKFFELMEKP